MTEQELKELKNQRTNLKKGLTRLSTFLDELDSTSSKIYQLEIRRQKLEENFEQFRVVQQRIDSLIENSDETEFETFEDKYFSLIGRITELQCKIDGDKRSKQSLSSDESSSKKYREVPLKLPDINLPKFDGEIRDWPAFKDTFNSLIHQNDSLSTVEKLHYLKSCLAGSASDLISDLAVTNTNYDVAWDLLHSRFDRKNLISYNHVQYLLELPKLNKATSSLSDLKKLVDQFMKTVRILKTLDNNTAEAEFILIPLLLSKLDDRTRNKWEDCLAKDSKPTLKSLEDFLIKQFNKIQWNDSLSEKKVKEKPKSCYMVSNQLSSTSQSQVIGTSVGQNNGLSTNRHNQASSSRYDTSNINSSGINSPSYLQCVLCKNYHPLYKCDQFRNMTVPERIKIVKKHCLCFNCLKVHKDPKYCSSASCKYCNSNKHHTSIHLDRNNHPSSHNNTGNATNSYSNVHHTNSSSNILLSTAKVNVQNNRNYNSILSRALLDSAAHCNLITEDLVQQLNLPKEKINSPISGIADSSTRVKFKTQATIKSCCGEYEQNLEFLILSKITDVLPHEFINTSKWDIPSSIILADPEFHSPQKIQLLIGAEIYFDLFSPGRFKINDSLPTLQNTKLGWIISGKYNKLHPPKHHAYNCYLTTSTPQDLDRTLTKFWELEEISLKREITEINRLVEENYENTTKREISGRYTVDLPFKTNPEILGNSASYALKRFYSLEKRFSKNPQFFQDYKNFMNEYLNLSHMVEDNQEVSSSNTLSDYYLVHHAVFRDSLTTKIRVVFDGSIKTNSGVSLNDILHVGPQLQDDLFHIILRFRSYRYALTADVEKMFRQILVNPDHIAYQKIFWRDSPDKEVKTYKLRTVTYGTTSAPYLAIRTLRQVAKDEAINYPLASKVASKDFYMDDCLCGADTLVELERLQHELSAMFQSAGFVLRKWCSNHIDFLNALTSNNTDPNFTVKITDNSSAKTLGLHWDPHDDTLLIKVTLTSHEVTSKRTMLSDIATIFDPFGLIGPVTTRAKIFLQELWQAKLEWDDPVPDHILKAWNYFKTELPALNQLKFPRYFTNLNNINDLELHGFCDSSVKAYGACIYVRSVDSDGTVSVQLLCSKSKVAPLKQVTLPRLELCAALLLAKLYRTVSNALSFDKKTVFLWSDSKIVLSWISCESTRWKVFVANRVSQIQSLTPLTSWRHISGKDNPSDILSRGASPANLIQSESWFVGPYWLGLDKKKWPVEGTLTIDDSVPERRKLKKSILLTVNSDLNFLHKFSSFNKLLRVAAFINRFPFNLKNKHNKLSGELSVEEIESAKQLCLSLCQREMFPKEYKLLSEGKPISSKSPLLPLAPFINKDLIRVGGRLRNSDLPFNQKHPIILDNNHQVSKSIFRQFHKDNLHCGPQALLSHVRQEYWIIKGKNLSKKIVHQCVPCFKAKSDPPAAQCIMADLPHDRVQLEKPFLNIGIDYAGPIMIKQSSRRNAPLIKTYICLFVCFATKAIHLELVGDLTTASFLAAFRRFVGRRGLPRNVYSDNGSNFVGCNNLLNDLYNLLSSNEHQGAVIDAYSSKRVSWTFIPSRSPHWGGIWEAGIKSAKLHLKKVTGIANLTYEECYTLLTQIEGTLNSRPMTPLPSEPDNDFLVLTPAHFLTGRPINYLPDFDYSNQPINYNKRWQLTQRAYRSFWEHWTRDYLLELQQRVKWKKEHPPLNVGDMVLIRDESTSPLQWPLGRVEQLHPGHTTPHIPRLVTVRTSKGLVRRVIQKLSPLPLGNAGNSES